LGLLKKEFTDRIVSPSQLSDKANSKNEALTGGRELESLSL